MPDYCKFKKNIDDLFNSMSCKGLDKKFDRLKELKEDPVNNCYFCGGHNHNCDDYEDDGIACETLGY